MYKLVFAHPATSECSWWDLVDGYNWNHCKGGLLRDDFSKKPAFDALKDLLHNQWKTNVKLTTDSNGNVQWNGFYGTYEVGDVSINFNSNQQENILVMSS